MGSFIGKKKRQFLELLRVKRGRQRNSKYVFSEGQDNQSGIVSKSLVRDEIDKQKKAIISLKELWQKCKKANKL